MATGSQCPSLGWCLEAPAGGPKEQKTALNACVPLENAQVPGVSILKRPSGCHFLYSLRQKAYLGGAALNHQSLLLVLCLPRWSILNYNHG